MAGIGVTIKDHDGSAPPPRTRPTHLGPEHEAVTAFREHTKENYRLLVRLVDSGHMDDKTLALLKEIAAKGAELHAHLDAVDAAWVAANAPMAASPTPPAE